MRQLVILGFLVTWTQLGYLQPLCAVTLGQVDDFSDLTTQGWSHGFSSPNPPRNVNTGGPDGTGDAYLEITSTNLRRAGGRLVGFNRAQWGGISNYVTEGITALVIDVNNFGATPLNLRLAINGAGGGFASTDPVPLVSGSGWRRVSLPLAAGDFTPVSGSGAILGTDFNATLGELTELRMLSSTAPAFKGDIILANLGVDNITAALRGDFNFDTLFDLQDLELLYRQHNLVAGVSTTTGDPFDLDGNELIDNTDLDEWLEIAGLHNEYTSAYQRGDADNVGAVSPAARTVDITDFNVLAGNFDPLGNSVTPNTWDRANFDGDTDVDITDFNLLAENFTPLGYGASAVTVPEPGYLPLLACVGLLFALFRCVRCDVGVRS